MPSSLYKGFKREDFQAGNWFVTHGRGSMRRSTRASRVHRKSRLETALCALRCV